MRKQDTFFVGMMLVVSLAMLTWTAVGLWPLGWVRWRAEMGDQAAIKEMYKRDVLENQGREAGYWASKFRKLSADDLIFMSATDQKIFRLLGVGEKDIFSPGPR